MTLWGTLLVSGADYRWIERGRHPVGVSLSDEPRYLLMQAVLAGMVRDLVHLVEPIRYRVPEPLRLGAARQTVRSPKPLPSSTSEHRA